MQEKQSRRSGVYRSGQQTRRRVPVWLIVSLAILTVAVGVVLVVRNQSARAEISAMAMPCDASQHVTPFGDAVLYYDGASIHCCEPGGGIRFSFPCGINAQFSASDTHLVIWSGTQLFIVNSRGVVSYNENMEETVQFARIGHRYCAVVVGDDDTEPALLIKNLDGTQADYEKEAYSGMVLLDAGFYGDQDRYLWTLSFDFYGVALNTVMHTYEVAKMNTGQVTLSNLAYKVVYENTNLRVFTTQQMYTYSYNAVPKADATRLTYGWQVTGVDIPARGDANILLGRTAQLTGADQRVTDVKVVRGGENYMGTLPEACVGIGVLDGTVWGVAPRDLYQAPATRLQAFSGQPIPLPEGKQVERLIGLTTNGYAVVACTDQTVYAVHLPAR